MAAPPLALVLPAAAPDPDAPEEVPAPEEAEPDPDALGALPAPDEAEPLVPAAAPPDAPDDAPLLVPSASVENGMASAAPTARAINVFIFMVSSFGMWKWGVKRAHDPQYLPASGRNCMTGSTRLGACRLQRCG
jgi:hypothetical protein